MGAERGKKVEEVKRIEVGEKEVGEEMVVGEVGWWERWDGRRSGGGRRDGCVRRGRVMGEMGVVGEMGVAREMGLAGEMGVAGEVRVGGELWWQEKRGERSGGKSRRGECCRRGGG